MNAFNDLRRAWPPAILGMVAWCALSLTMGQAWAQAAIAAFGPQTPGTRVAGWEPLVFKNIAAHTRYQLVRDAERQATVLEADAQASSSGLVVKLDVDAVQTPVLRFSWKVAQALEGSTLRRKEGDDYPARVYVTFAYTPSMMSALDRARYALAKTVSGEYPPHAALTYVVLPLEKPGTVAANPYTDRVKMIVVDAGKPGVWRTFERNILEDWRLAFGADTPMPRVSGVAVMTDTDNTGGTARAWFGDVSLGPK